MDNSTEELTPILVPFEKAAYGWRNKNPNSFNAKAAESMDTKNLRSPEYTVDGPDQGGFTGEQMSSDKSEEDPAPKSPSKGGAKTGGSNMALGGAALAANAAGSLVGGLGTVGNATRKLVQGMLNPGLMGQGAAGASLDAVDTVVTPDDAARARRNNLQEAAGVFAEGKALDDQKKAAAASAKTYDAMDQTLNGIFQQALQKHGFLDKSYLHNAGGVNPNNPNGAPLKMNSTQYAGFLSDFERDLSGVINQWIADGRDPAMVEELNERYGQYITSAKDRVKEMRDMEKAHQDTKEAVDARDKAVATDKIVGDTIKTISSNFNALAQRKDMGWLKDFLPWAVQNGMAKEDGQGGYVLSDEDFFVDSKGRKITDPDFNIRTAKIDFNSPDTNVNNYIKYLESTGDPKNLTLASKIRADQIAHAQNEKKMEQKGKKRFFTNVYGRSSNVGATKKALDSKLVELYGGDLTADQLDSLAKNKGLSSTSLDDYDALHTIHTGLHKTMRGENHLRKLKGIQEKILNEMRTKGPDEAMSVLTQDELDTYRGELVYQNLTNRLRTMDKMRSLDDSLAAFGKRVGVDDRKIVDENGMPLHISQQDALNRYRDMAFAEMQDALFDLNTDLDECIRATYGLDGKGKSKKLQSKWDNGNWVGFSENKPGEKDQSQAWHLAQMVISDHNSDLIGLLGDETFAGSDEQPADRRIHARMKNFYDHVNRANSILGRPSEGPDTSMVTSTLSEDAEIATAQANMLLAQMARASGYGQDSTAGNIITLAIPREANKTQGIRPISDLVRRYQYGEFLDSPPSSDEMSDIRMMADNLERMSDLTTSYGTPHYTPTQLNAIRQYHASLVMNSSKAKLMDMFNTTAANTLPPSIVDAYAAYTGRNITPAQARTELTQILNSPQYRAISDGLRGATPKNGAATFLGSGNSNYRGTRGPPSENKVRSMPQIISDPQMVIGLMNSMLPLL